MKSLNEIVEHEKNLWEQIFKKKFTKNQINFNRFSSFWDEDYYDKITRFIDSLIKKYSYKNLLEAGSGSGRSSIILSSDIERTLLDISPTALDYARHIAKNFGAKNIKFVPGNIFNLPFEDEKLDFVWNTGVIEHYDINAIEMILKEMIRTTKPGGMVAFGIPNFLSGPTLKAWILKYLPESLPGYRLETENFYKNKILKNSLIKIAKENNKNIDWIKIKYFGNPLPLESPKWLIKTAGKIIDFVFVRNRLMIMFICKFKNI